MLDVIIINEMMQTESRVDINLSVPIDHLPTHLGKKFIATKGHISLSNKYSYTMV